MQLAINAKPMAIFCAVRLKSKPTRGRQDMKKAKADVGLTTLTQNQLLIL